MSPTIKPHDVRKWKPSTDRRKRCSYCGKRGFDRWCTSNYSYCHISCLLRSFLNYEAGTHAYQVRSLERSRERAKNLWKARQQEREEKGYNPHDGIPDHEKTFPYRGQYSVWYESRPPRWDELKCCLLPHDKVFQVKL